MGSLGVCLFAGALVLGAADSALLFNKTIGGSGNESVSAVATDPSGNVILAGSTSSYDFPVTNGSANTATHFASSANGGAAWRALGSLPAGTPYTLAVDTSTPPIWYAAGNKGIFKSADGGATWTSAGPAGPPPCNYVPPFCGVKALAINPQQPSTICAIGDAGIIKSTDGGTTWVATTRPTTDPNSPSYLALDPSHPDHIFTSVVTTDFRSFDGGQTWTQYTPPLLHPETCCGGSPAFDPVTPGVVYLAEHGDLFRSTDGGIYWDLVSTPSQFTYLVVTSPSKSGVLYISTNTGLYGTTDGGATWTFLLANQYGNPPHLMAIDPNQPSTLLTETLRSTDGGATWSSLALGRAPTAIVFDPQTPGRTVAATAGAATSFLAKLDPNGAVLAATYFGGQGATSISGVTPDSAGNIYVTGTTSSPDFPAPPVTGAKSFVAKFDPALSLVYATFLAGGSMQGSGIAVDANGSATVTGAYTATQGHPSSCFVTKLAPDGRGVVFTAPFGGSNGDLCQFVTEDSTGNTVVAGTTWSRDFPVTGSGSQTSLHGYNDTIVAKFDPAGTMVYAAYLGGSDTDLASAVSVDAAGNIYVSGTTASKDFPTTDGAYQTSLRSHCAYPSSAVNTGMMGTIAYFRTDDAFLTKLDPSGNPVFSTYLGGDCYDSARSMAIDPAGNVWIAGNTNSDPFPQLTPFATGPAYAFYKGFVSELDAGGASLLFSSYVDAGTGPFVASDAYGNVYIAGDTTPTQSPYGGQPEPPVVSTGVHASLTKVQSQAATAVSIRSVGNAFTMRSGPVSPGQITLIAADGIALSSAVDLTLTPSAPLPRTLADTQVLFDGEAAAIVSVGAGRVVAIAPYDLAGKAQTSVQVVFQGVASAPVIAAIQADSGYESLDGSGTGQALARNPDGTLNSPQNPAPQGSTITVYLTGLGAVDPDCPEGGVAMAAAPLTLTGSSQVTSVPGSVCGLFQTTVRTPTYGAIPNVGLPNSALTYAVEVAPIVSSWSVARARKECAWHHWLLTCIYPTEPVGNRQIQSGENNELGPGTR